LESLSSLQQQATIQLLYTFDKRDPGSGTAWPKAAASALHPPQPAALFSFSFIVFARIGQIDSSSTFQIHPLSRLSDQLGRKENAVLSLDERTVFLLWQQRGIQGDGTEKVAMEAPQHRSVGVILQYP
jgi:hypothetical protein